jgi:hypothetical protein
LQLEADQRSNQARAGKLSPKESRVHRRLEQQQGLRLRGLYVKQRRGLYTERRRERDRVIEPTTRLPPPRNGDRDLVRERLDGRIQRETLGYGRR